MMNAKTYMLSGIGKLMKKHAKKHVNKLNKYDLQSYFFYQKADANKFLSFDMNNILRNLKYWLIKESLVFQQILVHLSLSFQSIKISIFIALIYKNQNVRKQVI